MNVPFVGPSYNLNSRQASVQRTVNLVPKLIEPGTERARWAFSDVPGLSAFGGGSGWFLMETSGYVLNEVSDHIQIEN